MKDEAPEQQSGPEGLESAEKSPIRPVVLMIEDHLATRETLARPLDNRHYTFSRRRTWKKL